MCARAAAASYGGTADARLPEFGESSPPPALAALHKLFRDAGFDRGRRDTAAWNPLAELIGPATRVLIKPNWVIHHNRSGAGEDCLITHGSVVESIARYVALAGARRVVVGDAPVQGCDFTALMSIAGNDRLGAAIGECRVVIEDFRRTVLPGGSLGGPALENLRPVEDYVLFDLGARSALEPITTPEAQFRVTMYDPDLLMRRHRPGTHQYLIAREIMESDLVINVPKLKTHQKAGVTGALKNLVGINGNKEFLPHHRKGGSTDGGDCYEGRSLLRSTVETMLDATNRARTPGRRRTYALATRAVHVTRRLLGGGGGYEGSWHGNDTVWRMCLDLQRILLYGKTDGTLDPRPQRRVLSITDAIVAGEGNGPLSPTPVPLGLLTLAWNPCSAEWVHALLMGFDPRRIPLIRESFSGGDFPLAAFPPSAVEVVLDGESVPLDQVYARAGRDFAPPDGWRGHCERTREPVAAAGRNRS